MNCLLVLYAMCIAIHVPNISGLNIFKSKQPTEFFKEGNCTTYGALSYTMSKVIYLSKKNPVFFWSGTMIIDCIKIRSEPSSKQCAFSIVEGGIGTKGLTLGLNNPSRQCKYYLDLLSYSPAATTTTPPCTSTETTEAPSTEVPATTKDPFTAAPDNTEAFSTGVPDTTEAYTTVAPDSPDTIDDEYTTISSLIEAFDTNDF